MKHLTSEKEELNISRKSFFSQTLKNTVHLLLNIAKTFHGYVAEKFDIMFTSYEFGR